MGSRRRNGGMGGGASADCHGCGHARERQAARLASSLHLTAPTGARPLAFAIVVPSSCAGHNRRRRTGCCDPVERLQDDEMLRARPQGCGPRHRPVEGDEPASTFDGESEQVDVSYLTWPVNAARVDPLPIQEADRRRPELVVLRSCRPAQALDRFLSGERARIARLADHANEAVFGHRAGCPALTDLGRYPIAGATVIDMIAIEQGDKHVDVEKSAPYSRSSSRSLSIS